MNGFGASNVRRVAVVLLLLGLVGLGLSAPAEAQEECGKVHEVIVTHVFTPKDLVLESATASASSTFTKLNTALSRWTARSTPER